MSENKDKSDEVIVLAPVRRVHPAVLVASGFFGGLTLCWLVRSLAESAEKRQAMRQLGKAP